MIEFANLSRYRSELMGVAMIAIILFHIPLGRADAFFGLHRLGNVGVDIFFFLSGMGLWFAWGKRAELLPFYHRRFARLMPAWLVMASLFYVPDFLGPRKYSPTLPNLLGDITLNLDFWRYDELTFWYIPAIMAFYLVAPFYMELIRRHPLYRWLPVLAVMWCVCVQWVVPIHQAVGHLEIFWSRVPIFFLGINIGSLVQEKQKLDRSALWLLLLFFVASFSACLYLEQVRHGKFPLFAERMLYIPMTVSALLLLGRLFESIAAHWPRHASWLLRPLAFVGTISLETYLIHVHFVMKPIAQYHLGYWPTFLLTVVISLPLAWLLHQLTKPIVNFLSPHQSKSVNRKS